jgi:UDP-N-acetylmuramoyl-L-alanyl-D-glutamate--2,6-diaminopimelate ligase
MTSPRPPPPWASAIATVGITGTNGKTTTTTLLAAALRWDGAPVLRVTTLGHFLDDERLLVAGGHAGFIQAMDRLRSAGGSRAAMELTSEALGLGFARAWPCRVGVFTNLSRDHLDAHGSAEHYLASKAQLFVALPAGGTAVLNACDPACALLAEVIPAGVRTTTYGAATRGGPWTAPDLSLHDLMTGWNGTRARLRWSSNDTGGGDLPPELATRAIGAHFVEDAAAALLGAVAMGVPAGEAARAIAAAAPPAGRMEVVARAPAVVVDYAHTPDALARTVVTARALVAAAGDALPGRLSIVFGAGGGRDRAKRGAMGAAASGADAIWLTSDNPRNEDPRAIADAVRAGLGDHPAVVVELDRARAIEGAIAAASPGDVVVIAGKGHEEEQIGPAGARRAFSDREVARAAHARRGVRSSPPPARAPA